MKPLCAARNRKAKSCDPKTAYSVLVRTAALGDELPSESSIRTILKEAKRSAKEFDRDVDTLTEIILFRRTLPTLKAFALTKTFAAMASSIMLAHWAIGGIEKSFNKYLRSDRLE
jgi:hypothetical protein